MCVPGACSPSVYMPEVSPSIYFAGMLPSLVSSYYSSYRYSSYYWMELSRSGPPRRRSPGRDRAPFRCFTAERDEGHTADRAFTSCFEWFCSHSWPPSLADLNRPRLWTSYIHPGLLQRGRMCSPVACILPPGWRPRPLPPPHVRTQVRYPIQGEVCTPTSPLG